MEYTTRFTLVCHHASDAEALHAAFSAEAGDALEASIKAFFAERKVAIYPPDGMGFDHCEPEFDTNCCKCLICIGQVLKIATTTGTAGRLG